MDNLPDKNASLIIFLRLILFFIYIYLIFKGTFAIKYQVPI